MLNINLLTSATNIYMSQFDYLDKNNSTKSTLLAINEAINSLEHLKQTIKSKEDSLSILNILSLCLSISELTKDIEDVSYCLKNHK